MFNWPKPPEVVVPGLVGVLVTLGMVLVARLGLSLLDTVGLLRLRRGWPLLGIVAGVALLLSRGPLAVALGRRTPWPVRPSPRAAFGALSRYGRGRRAN